MFVIRLRKYFMYKTRFYYFLFYRRSLGKGYIFLIVKSKMGFYLRAKLVIIAKIRGFISKIL